MAAPGLSRVRLLAGLGSLIVHAIALGAFFWAARFEPVGFGVTAPAITLVEIEHDQPRTPPAAPAPSRSTLAPEAETASPPAAVAAIIPSFASAQTSSPQAPSKAEEDAYARAVWLHLAAHRPRAVQGVRNARVAFGLTPNGQLRYVVLERSSGSATFDSLCLSAVRDAAPFPPAPAGISDSLLDFVAPIATRAGRLN